MDHNCKIQLFEWVLQIKCNLENSLEVRYRARLVSTSNMSHLKNSSAENAPTIAIRTVRLLLAIVPTWSSILQRKGDHLAICVRDVTKAYLQSDPTESLIFYRPPTKAKEDHSVIWQEIRQLYGEVNARRYWRSAFVPWLRKNSLDLKPLMYDPALLYKGSYSASLEICTDDVLLFLPL